MELIEQLKIEETKLMEKISNTENEATYRNLIRNLAEVTQLRQGEKAYVNNLISNDMVWIHLLEDRNSTSHIYNEELADEVANRIVKDYVKAIGELIDNLEKVL